jgi:hypothetical protein
MIRPTLSEIKQRVATLRKPSNQNPPGHMFDDVHELMAIIAGLQADVQNRDRDIRTLGAQVKTKNRELTKTIGTIKKSSLVDYYWKKEIVQLITKAIRIEKE